MNKITDKEALQRFETIWEHVECGITIVDAKTREIIDINPVAARMFGDDKAKIIGKRCHQFICPSEEKNCPIMDKNQTVDRSERRFKKANGEIIPIIKSVSIVNYEGRLVLLESFTDISNLKEAEEKVLQLSLAEQSSKAKSEFLSRMSHEIRTPMNAIIGMTRIAENTEDVDKLRYCMQNISVSSNHLLGIINDVLDMSKIEAGKFELDSAPFNIEKMLSKICGITLDMIEQKGIDFQIILKSGLRCNYIGDEMRISQVLTNLLSNAIKFTPSGGSIKVFINELGRDDDYSDLRITVTDTGIGMSNDQIERLFRSFEQADNSTSRRFGGTGLGLSITKTIIEKMGGRIWAESKVGVGSNFICEFKLQYDKNARIEKMNHFVKIDDIKMLIVDSNIETISYLNQIVESLGIKADLALSGIDAIKLAKDKSYNVIFIDNDLNDGNALDVVRRIRLIENNSVIIMSSFRDWNKIEAEAKKIGISRFIAKPLLPSTILDTINEVFAKTVKKQEISKGDIVDFSNISIILAEDVEINREILISLLEPTHINIKSAENGEEALNLFKQNQARYNLILMDVQMPIMDGYEATKLIRSINSKEAKNIPIIALTANVFQEDIDKCLNCGMNDHLAKPIDIDNVINMIKKYI